ncbi:MAG: hypothetical protein OEX12_06725 [Gammaproteobacteria bacterium]|nr:hypothetical protein [Gammaproteobacteria bacterium]
MAMPSYEQQIIQTHAGLIVQVAQAVFDAQVRMTAESSIEQLKRFGETKLADALQQILGGSRNESLLIGLDEADQVIVKTVLLGIQNPDTLPDPKSGGEATAAAPGLAHMIHASASGNPQALQLLASMAEQMTAAGGDMKYLGGMMRKMVNGEREAEVLTKGMGSQGQSLVLSILEELARLDLH